MDTLTESVLVEYVNEQHLDSSKKDYGILHHIILMLHQMGLQAMIVAFSSFIC